MPRILAVLVTLTLAGAPARAGWLTPDSILRPPPATLPGVAGTPVPSADLVTDQYAGLGAVFPLRVVAPTTAYATAVASIEGVNAWAGVYGFRAGADWSWDLSMDGLSAVAGDLTKPASSLAVDFVWAGGGTGYLSATTAGGGALFASVAGGPGVHRATVTGAEIVSFYAMALPEAARGGPAADTPFAWGVSAIGLDVAQAPEPASWVLAGLGVLAVLRRSRTPQPTRPPIRGAG